MTARKSIVTAVIIITLAAASVASAAFPIPAPPDWFVVPPDGATRLQHHSFHADPNLNQPPDWTANGFDPAIPDQWTMPTPVTYNVANPNAPWGVYWENGGGGAGVPLYGGFLNDNIGADLPQGGTLTKKMGNLADESKIKEFYALMIWAGVPGTFTQLDMSVSSPGTTVNTTTFEAGEAGLFATVIEGTITPQPDFEDFSFVFSGPTFVDEVYIGTHCVPEPSTTVLLCMGAFGLLLSARRRRR